eukprot:558524-Hanusia_phi.AAC.1
MRLPQGRRSLTKTAGECKEDMGRAAAVPGGSVGGGGNEEGKGRRIGDCQVILTPARIELGRSLGRMVVGRLPLKRMVFDLPRISESPYSTGGTRRPEGRGWFSMGHGTITASRGRCRDLAVGIVT